MAVYKNNLDEHNDSDFFFSMPFSLSVLGMSNHNL